MVRRVHLAWTHNRFPGSKTFWRDNYREGGHSGFGSLGELAAFKARVLNDFVASHGIESVIELGCGDGNQLALAEYPQYTGLDISPDAIKLCIERFAGDKSKAFFVYDGEGFHDPIGRFRAELAISLDVVFHLVEDDVFETYMQDLFGMAERFVVIYSVNDERWFPDPYSRARRFTDWIDEHRPDWKLIQHIPNEYPSESWSEFYVFELRD